MGHLTSKDAYKTLDDRLNLFPQGAPPSESLYQILRVLFTEKEAQMVSQLPIRPFTIKKPQKSGSFPSWKRRPEAAQHTV